jgi:hypothetical protein
MFSAVPADWGQRSLRRDIVLSPCLSVSLSLVRVLECGVESEGDGGQRRDMI